ncbi:SurA N-terminal domain-containing protein [Aestuariibaculum lutulentum]|uniref:Periplasmic chaperone PpiD n=1 Tax=Aestuariibaculum lutulentum TaxID=2920935 RepID=A0ABS9RLZ9_9FLAO|nr:SurA N-terminal domain-containing protein [Aestuariibaculum lutulentum]MCH4553571.1 SurA N-terminal domain-containing protein [Aestuariibaculum lutulentum]
MAVLNKIRQRSLFLIVVIALALFSFVLADLFKSGSAFAGSDNVVATINGREITREDFLQKVEIAQRQLGPNATSTQVMNRVWEQEVRTAVLETQFEELGITVEKDQMRDILKTALANSPEFLNEAGLFDENKLNEYIANLKETSPEGYAQWVEYEKTVSSNALQQNYFSMVKAGLTGTLAEGELEYKLEGNKVDIKYVQLPYSSIADSLVEVSKSDISSYISKNKKKYEVEASRDIKFVQFNEVASVEDENEIKGELVDLLKDKEEYNSTTKANETVKGFLSTTDDEGFVNSNSDIKFDNRFLFKSSIPSTIADSIFKLNAGEIYGPYKDNGYYKISKVVAVKQVPDSAKVRHILIPFIGAQMAGAEVTQTDAQAKTTADSLLAVIKGDRSKFSELVTEFSSDKGSVDNEGRYDWHPYNTMVPEFNDFEFEGNVGDLGVVKTVFGYHIIEIEGLKEKQKAVQVGTIARRIEPSEATIDKVFRDASSFELAVLDGKDFDAEAEAQKFVVRPVNGIKVLDENIPGVGNQRQIVRWAFEEGTRVGTIKRFSVTNGYVLAQLVAKHEKGLMSVEEATASVLPIIRKEKKAEMLRDKVSATNLDDLASSQNTSVRTASAINMKNPTISGAGREPIVVGAAFGLNEGDTSDLIDGNNGVYMIQVTKVEPAVALENYQAAANRVEQQKMNVVTSKLYNALKEAADIEDNRVETQIQ